MKNVVVYMIAIALVFIVVIEYKDAVRVKKRIESVERSITPKDDGFLPPVNSGWKIVGDIDGVQVYRKYDCLDNGVGCHWIYLTIGKSDRQINMTVK